MEMRDNYKYLYRVIYYTYIVLLIRVESHVFDSHSPKGIVSSNALFNDYLKTPAFTNI